MRSGKRTAACINAMLGAPTLFILSPKQKTMTINHSSHWMLRRSKRETAFHEGFVAFQIRHGGGGWDGLGRADSSGGEGTGTDSSEATSSLSKERKRTRRARRRVPGHYASAARYGSYED